MRIELTPLQKALPSVEEQQKVMTADEIIEQLDSLIANNLQAMFPGQVITGEQLIAASDSQMSSMLTMARYVVMQGMRGNDRVLGIYDIEHNESALTVRFRHKPNEDGTLVPDISLNLDLEDDPIIRTAERHINESIRRIATIDFSELDKKDMPQGWSPELEMPVKEKPLWANGETVYHTAEKVDEEWLCNDLGVLTKRQERIFLNDNYLTSVSSANGKIEPSRNGIIHTYRGTDGDLFIARKKIESRQGVDIHRGHVDSWTAGATGVAYSESGHVYLQSNLALGSQTIANIFISKDKDWALDSTTNDIYFYDKIATEPYHIIRRLNGETVRLDDSAVSSVKKGYFGYVIADQNQEVFRVIKNDKLAVLCTIPREVTNKIGDWQPHPGVKGYDGIIIKLKGENRWVFYGPTENN
jgi:hypothetical protein